jgi:hypothetical protein
VRVFIRCLQQEGPEALAAYLLRNERDGIHTATTWIMIILAVRSGWAAVHKGKKQE